MHDENDPEIEFSPLCEEVTRDGLSVRVQIYRLKTGNDGWSLEVIDHENASTVWDDLFATDHEALAEFSQTLDDEGIQSFFVDRDRTDSSIRRLNRARAEGEEMTANSTEILQKMVEADGYIEVVRGPTDEYITVCRPNGTALFEGLLPREILEDFKAAWFVRQDGPENERGVTIFRLTADARRAATPKGP